MKLFWILFSIIIILVFAFFMISYICFRMAFYVSKKQKELNNNTALPKGKEYEPYYEKILEYAGETAQIPHTEFCITSFDGLKLYGKYYECNSNAPIELMFHGYRGKAERDLAGGVQRCFKLGRNALIVDQRCSGKSEGNVITFGIKEHRDCLAWVDFMLRHFGDDVKIILTGISMGATTVLIASGCELPKNVIGILADCGFSSAKEIIKRVIKKMHLPAKLAFFFVKIGAEIYGKFDIEEITAEEALKRCTVPVIFFHGENDDFVPCEMSQKNFDACASKKLIITVKGAGHGLSFLTEPERYYDNLNEFFGE